ncbi:hypothetical protein ACF1AY_09090 [Streptomyces sp. NPDC014776]
MGAVHGGVVPVVDPPVLAALSLLTGVVWLVHRFRRSDDGASGP